MDKKWRSSQRDSSKPYKKGRGHGSYNRKGVLGPLVPSTAAEELAEYVLTVLARNSSSLTIKREEINPAYVRVLVTCEPDVTGRLIGKGGRTITALRLLVKTAANHRGKRVDIEVTS